MVLASAVPVLLIRGLTREQRHWGQLRPMLAQQLANPVVSFDFAGTGQLWQQRSPCSISALRQSIRVQLQQSPLFYGKVHLVALSLGAMLAADWARRYPREVASITLINSSARPLSPFYRRLSRQNYLPLICSIQLKCAQREQHNNKCRCIHIYFAILPSLTLFLYAM